MLEEAYILSASSSALASIMMFLAIVVVAAIIVSYNENKNHTKSHGYRKFLTNLFVSSKIRQLAVTEKLDLDKEYLEYLKFNKINKEKFRREIDQEIENKISDSINPDTK
jgi:hypothetical protein